MADKDIIQMRTIDKTYLIAIGIDKTDLIAIRIDKTDLIVGNLRARLNQSVCHIMWI